MRYQRCAVSVHCICALYLSEMSPNGSASQLNKSGAAYETGYCDAQCGVANFVNGVLSSYGQSNSSTVPN